MTDNDKPLDPKFLPSTSPPEAETIFGEISPFQIFPSSPFLPLGGQSAAPPPLSEPHFSPLVRTNRVQQFPSNITAQLPDRNIEASAMNLIHPLLSPAGQAAWDAARAFEYSLVARTKEDPDHAAARIGGLPLLPADFVWPEKDGETYILVATVDLARVAAEAPHPFLPAEGFLFFFYADGEYEDGRVIHSHGPCVVRADPTRPVFSHEKAMRVSPRWALNLWVPAIWDDLERLENSKDREVARALTILKWTPEPDHHLLGVAKEIQCPVEEDWERLVQKGFGSPPDSFENADDRRWILLLQLDSDSNMDMYWGDMGCIYYRIRLGDLKERRFEKVVVACQFG